MGCKMSLVALPNYTTASKHLGDNCTVPNQVMAAVVQSDNKNKQNRDRKTTIKHHGHLFCHVFVAPTFVKHSACFTLSNIDSFTPFNLTGLLLTGGRDELPEKKI